MEAVAASLNGEETEEPLLGLVMVIPPEAAESDEVPEEPEEPDPEEGPEEPEEELDEELEPDELDPDVEPDEESEPEEFDPDEEPDEPEPVDEPEPEVEPEDGGAVTGVLVEAVMSLVPALPQPVPNTAAAVSRHIAREEFFIMFAGSLLKSVKWFFQVGFGVGAEIGGCGFSAPRQPISVSSRLSTKQLNEWLPVSTR